MQNCDVLPKKYLKLNDTIIDYEDMPDTAKKLFDENMAMAAGNNGLTKNEKLEQFGKYIDRIKLLIFN